MNLGELEIKEITRPLYRMPVAVANSFVYLKMKIKTDYIVSMMFPYHRVIAIVFVVELCVQLQDVGGSSSNSNNIEFGRGIDINEGARMLSNRWASSPGFGPYVIQPGHSPPPRAPPFEDHRILHDSITNRDDHQAGLVNSNNGEKEEFISETQPPVV
ncbi:hypothetical protein PIB30_066986 [Stylosanthes scabra]|uniref:Uncharacterized protein n=1 Tax=Stylosanthes scabra TaxID=79078 RepID=A0ABU6QLZ9_9FABA|nr:hypothetical protein [Stylosanthes scabra]